MIKTTVTTYTIDQPAGQYITIHQDGDFIYIRRYWANDEIETEVEIHATVGVLTDLITVIDEIENAVLHG